MPVSIFCQIIAVKLPARNFEQGMNTSAQSVGSWVNTTTAVVQLVITDANGQPENLDSPVISLAPTAPDSRLLGSCYWDSRHVLQVIMVLLRQCQPLLLIGCTKNASVGITKSFFDCMYAFMYTSFHKPKDSMSRLAKILLTLFISMFLKAPAMGPSECQVYHVSGCVHLY